MDRAMPWSKIQGSQRYARRTLAGSKSTRKSSSHISAMPSALETLRLCPGRVCQPQTKPGVGISLTLIDAQSTGQKNPTPRLLVHLHLDTPFVTAGPLQAAEKKPDNCIGDRAIESPTQRFRVQGNLFQHNKMAGRGVPAWWTVKCQSLRFWQWRRSGRRGRWFGGWSR